MKRILFISLLIIASFTGSRATHIVGGDFELTYSLKGYNYDLRLNLYFDAISGNEELLAENVLIVGIYSKTTNALISTHSLEKVSDNEFIPYQNPDCQVQELVTRIIRYRKAIALSPNEYNEPGGYYVMWDRCCRNEFITNISDPLSTGMIFYMEFPPVVENDTVLLRNDSPVFAPPFAEYACVGQSFQYDFSATDADGDSLAYRMNDPWTGEYNLWFDPGPHPAPYDVVDWLSGYNANNAIDGSPTLSIDPETGQLSVTPTQQGLFVFSVSVDEYRDGVKIGSVKRDYQLLVRPPCDPNIAPSVLFYHEDGSLYAEGDTVFVDGNDDFEYDLKFTDSLTENDDFIILQLTTSALNYTPNLMSVSNSIGAINANGDTTTSKVSWNPCSDSEGEVWKTSFLLTDDGCPLPLTDTVEVWWVVTPADNNDPFVYTSLSDDTISLEVWHDTTFVVYGEDIDNHDIVLEGEGIGYNFGDKNMSFATVSGQGMVSSQFYMYVDCAMLEQEYFAMRFKVDDNWCNAPNDSSTQVVVRVFETPFVPQPFEAINVFTPNGDGINDCFELPTLPEEKCDGEFVAIEIYNRWGSRVYSSDQRNFSWKGEGVNTGIYYYYIQYENNEFKGWVQILR